ncbi:hypothetical protein ACOMHN_031505 [Nucella lapillus]
MQHYGFPLKYIAIIQQLYEDATCRVIHEGKLTDPFQVQTGVRQGCLLSPTIFLMVVDWIMRQSTAGQKTGIQWTFTKQLEDLDFADDITLLSHRQQHAQEKLERVAVEAEKIGLRINIGKTEILRFNNQQQDPVRLQQEEIKEVEKFTYLGSVVSKDGGADDDIKSRISKARHAFKTLQPIWQSSALSLHNKIRIFNTNVKSVLLYGSETWRTTKTNRKKLQTFINSACATSSTSGGQKSSQMKTCGPEQNKHRSEKTSGRGNGGGSATQCASHLQTSPGRHWTGTPKEKEKLADPGRLGEEARRLK